MFLPIGTDRPRRRPTLITYWLIGINVLMYMWQVLAAGGNVPGEELLTTRLPLFWMEGNDGSWGVGGEWWQYLTYQFLHAGPMHLLGNMLFLFVFGPPVEDRLRRWWFLAFYMAGGVIAGISHSVFESMTLDGGDVRMIPAVVGASGAIAAVTGAFLVLFPLVRIRILLFFFLVGIFEIPAWWFIAFAIAKDVVFSAMGGEGIAYAAHLGGYVFGAVIALVLLWTKVLAREPYDLFSIGRQAHRRAQYRDLVSKRGGAFMKDSAATGRVAQAKRERERRRDVQRTEARGEINSALQSKRPDDALRMYKEMLDREPDAVLSRDAQHQLGVHAYGSGDHNAASTVFELFLKRYGSDREADEVRLLLAIIDGRYLNDPVRAKALLAELDESRLTPAHADLARALREELG